MIVIPLDCLRDLFRISNLGSPLTFLGIETLGKDDFPGYIRSNDLLLSIFITGTSIGISNYLHRVSLEPKVNSVQYNMHDYNYQVFFYLFDMLKCKVVGHKACWNKINSVEVINKLCVESDFIRFKSEDGYIDSCNLYSCLIYSLLSPEYINWIRKYVEVLRCMSAVSSKDYFLPELQQIMYEHINIYPLN